MRFTKKKYLEMCEAFRNKELDLYPNEIAKILNTDVYICLGFVDGILNISDAITSPNFTLDYIETIFDTETVGDNGHHLIKPILYSDYLKMVKEG